MAERSAGGLSVLTRVVTQVGRLLQWGNRTLWECGGGKCKFPSMPAYR
jgi:hypothetical protein